MFGDQDGGLLAASNAVNFLVQATTNLTDENWVTLPASPVLTNGKFLLIEADATNYSHRFYRVLEQ